MIKTTLLAFLLSVFFGSALNAQTIYQTASKTYSGGDIATDVGFQNTGGASTCPGTISFAPGTGAGQIPGNSIIVSVDVEYSMTAANGATMSEQRSEMRCTAPGGTSEGEVFSPSDQWIEGTWNYSRTGLTIAAGITTSAFASTSFQLHAGTTYWNAPAGCSIDFEKVDNGTWTVAVHYLAPGSPNLPSNPTPANMAQLVDVNSNLSWNVSANTTSYDVYFGTDNPPLTKVVDNAATGGATTGTYDPGTLSNATTYYWYVVARNAANEIGSAVWSFTTDCGALSIPLFDNFDSYAPPALPDCWLSVSTVNNPDCYVRVENNWSPYSGSNTMNWVNLAGEMDPNITMVLPKVGNLSDYMISFYGLNGSNIFWGTPYSRPFEIGTMSDPYDANTFTSLTSWVPSATNWEYFEFLFLGVSTTDQYIAIRGDLNMDENQMYMDDFTLDLIPSCIKPQAVTADDIQANQVTISWTDYSTPTEWIIEYGATGYSPGTGFQTSVFTNPATIYGLTDATDYDFYVQTNCGGGDLSAWSQPLPLQTACLPFGVPVFEDFGEVPPYPEVPEYPVCWSEIEMNVSEWGGMGPDSYDALSGVCVYMAPEGDATSELILITPEFSDNINTLFTNFWLNSYEAEMIVGTISDPSDYTTFTGYDTIFSGGNVYVNHSVYFNSYVGSDTRIAFRMNAADYPIQQIRIDNITIDAIPSCVEPYKPWIDGETQTSAMLNWIDPMSIATNYQIEVGLPGFVVGTGAETNAYTPNLTAAQVQSFEMTGLSPSTVYEAYIRANCGGGDYSVWVGPFSFLTLFDAFGSLPVTENFESGFGITGNDPSNGTNWAINTNLQHGGMNSVHNVSGNSDDNILYLLGTFDFTGKANIMLTFWQIAKTYNNYDHCYIEISLDGGSTFDQLPESTYAGAGNYREAGLYNNPEGPCFDEVSYSDWGTDSETPDNSWWKKEYFNLTDYNTYDNVVIRFRLVTDTWTGGYRAGWYLDDISVEALGSPVFYADPLLITEEVSANMPATVDLTMGNSGSLPTTYTATVVYNETELLNENFDAGIPVDWTVINNGNNSVTWAVNSSANSPYYDFDGTQYAFCDGYQNYGDVSITMDDYLVSPVIDASAYIGAGLQLEFDQAFVSNWTDGDSAKIDVYDGTQWVNIYNSWNTDGELSWNSNGTHKAYIVSAFANANFQVRFHYIDGPNGRGQYFAIDNFRLRASLSALGWLTINGVEYTDGTAMPDADNLPSIINANMDATGLAVGIYTADIQVTSTDPGNPSTTIPVTMNVLNRMITGNITYGNVAMTPMNACTVQLYDVNNQLLLTTTSDASGHYEFSGLLDGDYTIQTSSTKIKGGLTPFDATLILRYYGGVVSFGNLQKRAADVNMTNTLTGVTPFDATLVLRNYGGVEIPQWTVPDYVFDGPYPSTTPLSGYPVNIAGSNVMANYQSLCSGDVNGSHTPTAK